MAIAISANVSKKIQLPGHDYASQQASITITGEVTDVTKVGEEAARLFGVAEAAVDSQLRLIDDTRRPVPAAPSSAQSQQASRPGSSAPAPSASRGYSRPGRRVAPVSSSQLGLINRLLTETRTDASVVLNQHHIGALADLSCSAASALIDELKTQSTGSRS